MDPAAFSRVFEGIDVFTSEHVTRGCPALIPDPRESPPLFSLYAVYGRRRAPEPKPAKLVLVVHPEDADRLPELLKGKYIPLQE